MNRLRFVTSLWLPLLLAAAPAAAQTARPVPGAQSAAQPVGVREASRLQMTIMEDAFQRAVEAVHARAMEAVQIEAGIPPMITLDGNSRARAFRLDGYGVFFDVDLPPIPRSVEWTFRVLDTGAILAPDIEQLQQQIVRLNDARVTRVLDPIVRSMRTKVAAGSAAAGGPGQAPGAGATTTLVGERSSTPVDPFSRYVSELKATLVQVMIEYGPTVRLSGDDWLHVSAREMAPKLMPGNPTDATLTFRIKAADLAALKAGRLTQEEAARRVEIKEIY